MAAGGNSYGAAAGTKAPTKALAEEEDSPQTSLPSSSASTPSAGTTTTATATSSSSTSTFAFASWKATLELILQREGDAVSERVQTLQNDFDDRSLFVRGDFAWRRQIATYHDRLLDALSQQLQTFVGNVSEHAVQVAESLAQSLAKAERDSQSAVQQQEQKGEAALRRARAAMATEVERITRLEKCLRREEARQAAVTYAEREREIQEQHEKREKQLQAVVSDLRASGESLEAVNMQLLESLRTARTDLDQLRNTLVNSMSRPTRRGSSIGSGGSRSTLRSSPTRGAENSGKDGVLGQLPAGTGDLLLVPTLQKALSAATQSVASLKKRVAELENSREGDKKRLREAQQAAAHAEAEKTKAAQLLQEARTVLVGNETQLAQAAGESARWRDRFDALQSRVEGQERALEDAQRLEDAAREHVASLEMRVQSLQALEIHRQQLERAVDDWRVGRATERQEESECSSELERIVVSFLHASPDQDLGLMARLEEQQQHEKKRLRFEFERRFGEQLKLRVSHERRRLLERLERLCAEEVREKQELLQAQQERARQLHGKIPRPSSSRSRGGQDFPRLQRLLTTAYDQLGVCVGAWADTDLEAMHMELDDLRAEVTTLELKLETSENRLETQRVTLVRAELAQQEKDLLLAELTARYRQLRTAQQAWSTQQQQQQQQEQQEREPQQREPLTVYGVTQPMATKPRLHSLLQLPTRARPASASACLTPTQRQSQQSNAQIHANGNVVAVFSPPPPSRLGSRPASCGAARGAIPQKATNRDEQQRSLSKPRHHSQERGGHQAESSEEHIRSMLKSELLRQGGQNQVEETVGADGVLEILHRRRHRK